MPRASYAERAERLNWARSLLLHEQTLAVTRRLAHRYSISLRQAYRYIEQAQHLQQPLPIEEAKIAFTVKLSKNLVQQVRWYAQRNRLSLSAFVGRALRAMLERRQGRG
jgi:predicted DNA-binding transcriptional regulator YafY